MKAIFLFLFAFTFGYDVKGQDATVYLFRTSRFVGVLANFTVKLDGKKICKLSNKRFLKLSLKPGIHHLESYFSGISYISNAKNILDFETKESENYYIETSSNLKSIVGGKLKLVQVDKKRGDELMSKITKLDYCQRRQ